LLDITTPDLQRLAENSGLPQSKEFADSLCEWIIALHEVSLSAQSDEYHRLFEGAMVCPLNETAYIRRDKGVIIGDICGFYSAFGWDPLKQRGEKPDHLVTELQFLGVLLTMLAQVQFEDDNNRSQIVMDGLRKFGSDHLGDWLPVVADNVAEKTRSPSYRALSQALKLFWSALVADREIPVTPPEAIAPIPSIPTLAPADEDLVDSPYEPCGFESAPGLVQLRNAPTKE
jgi:TorA maturation chaperone TorD